MIGMSDTKDDLMINAEKSDDKRRDAKSGFSHLNQGISKNKPERDFSSKCFFSLININHSCSNVNQILLRF